MKKIISLALVVLMISSMCVHGAVGDVVGDIYSTDIVTYMYYAPITSYNIGGKTCIDAEILNWHYGFDVYWRPETRRLEITDKGGRFVSLHAMGGSIVESKVSEPGKVVGNFYETDIKAILNGKEIESYNIGGRTMICAEAMRDFGYNVDWNPEKRTLTISKPMDFYVHESDFGTIRTMDNLKTDLDKLVYLKRDVLVTKDGVQYFLDIPSDKLYCNASGITYIKLSDLVSVLKGKCSMKENTSTAVTTWVNGIEDRFDYYTYDFEFEYDESVSPILEEMKSEDYRDERQEVAEPNLYTLALDASAFVINGAEYQMKALFGGKEFDSCAMVVEGEVYVPAHTLAKLLGYEYAW